MTKSERETYLFTRCEFLEIFSGHFTINTRKWDRTSMEEFLIHDTDVDSMVLRYSASSIERNFFEGKIYEIFISTWSGGWNHLQSHIKIEWDDYNDTGYNIRSHLYHTHINEELSCELKKANKNDVLIHLVKFFTFIEPKKSISLEREIKLKQLIE
jgi:hypothetical protein